MQLRNIHLIEGTLVCETGLHIGADSGEMHIGGVDNGVVKHGLTGEPYIPGSSLKGKVRSLLEWRSGHVKEGPLSWRDYQATKSEDVLRILSLFGVGGSDQLSVDEAEEVGPTRLSFWDAPLDPVWVAEQKAARRLLTETKSENIINRISGTAEHPRQTERVPAGARFVFRVSLKDLTGDADFLTTLLEGLRLLELDGLGGSTSRGYGKVRFENLSIDGEDLQARLRSAKPFREA